MRDLCFRACQEKNLVKFYEQVDSDSKQGNLRDVYNAGPGQAYAHVSMVTSVALSRQHGGVVLSESDVLEVCGGRDRSYVSSLQELEKFRSGELVHKHVKVMHRGGKNMFDAMVRQFSNVPDGYRREIVRRLIGRLENMMKEDDAARGGGASTNAIVDLVRRIVRVLCAADWQDLSGDLSLSHVSAGLDGATLLRVLEMRGSPRVKLLRVDVSRCDAAMGTSNIFHELTECCPYVKEIRCRDVKALHRVAPRSRYVVLSDVLVVQSLKKLDLSGCTSLTRVDMIAPALEEIRLSGCSALATSRSPLLGSQESSSALLGGVAS